MRVIPLSDELRTTVKIHVHISFPLGEFTGELGSRVIELGVGYIKLGTSSNSQQITLENTSQYGKRVQDLFSRAHPVHGSEVRVFAKIDTYTFSLCKGVINRISKWTRHEITFEVNDYGVSYARRLGTVLNKDDYAGLPERNVGKIIPWVWGTLPDFVPVLVDEDKMTKLVRSVTKTDSKIYVADANELPAATAVVQINDEKIQYTIVDTSTPGEHFLDGLTRSFDGTSPGSHVVGNQVIESGAIQFLVANHDVTTIDNVRAIDSDNVLVSLDTSLFTVTLTKPARIDFTKAIEYERESPTHKLKLMDADTLVGTSGTVNNPTYMIGGHADWEVLNFAELLSGSYCDIKRAAAVTEPDGGSPIRVWIVVEFWQSASTIGEVWWNPGGGMVKLGDLPDASDTPEEILEDQTIIVMGQGFQDQHSHTIPLSDHYHDAYLPELNFNPDTDDYLPASKDISKAYDGSDISYADVDLESGIGKTRVCNMETTQIAHENRDVLAIRAQVIFHEKPNVTNSQTMTIESRHSKGGGGTKAIEVWTGDLGVNGSGHPSYTRNEPFTGDTDFVDVTADNIDTEADGNANMRFDCLVHGSFGAWPRVYNVKWTYVLSKAPTDNKDTGDTDTEGYGKQTVLGWFEISDTVGQDWQYVVNKTLRLKATGAGEKVWCFRYWVCAEFAPHEKQFLQAIVCNVVGRNGNFKNIIEDILTQADLLGVPASRISLPTLSNLGAGALMDHVEGWPYLDRVLQEARCHGWWDWDGIFNVKFRELIASLSKYQVGVTHAIDEVVKTIDEISSVSNKIITEYNYDFIEATFADSLEEENAASIAKYGEKEITISLSFIRDQSEAQAVTLTMLDYLKELYETVIVDTTAIGLQCEPADVIAVNADDIIADCLEVKEVRLMNITSDSIIVSITGKNYEQ
jgi:hypothetical protein